MWVNVCHFKKFTVDLRVLSTLSTGINCLSKNLVLNFLLGNCVSTMLSDSVDPYSFFIVTFLEHFFLNCIHSLDVCNVPLVVCGQRNTSAIPRELENIHWISLSLYVCFLMYYWRIDVPLPPPRLRFYLF